MKYTDTEPNLKHWVNPKELNYVFESSEILNCPSILKCHNNNNTLKANWRRQWHPTPVLLPGNSHRWRSLVGCSPWGREESDTTEWLHFHFHALEKKMATHSSVLAWRIPGMAEPGRLPSMGSHRVRHNWSNSAAAARQIISNNSRVWQRLVGR